MTLENWLDIADDFTHAVLLGNGASVAIHSDFKYKSLWDAALENETISEALQSISAELNTGPNFELLLRQLWTAETVDEKFEIDATRIQKAYAQLRKALIAAVQTVHCEHGDAIERLRQATPFLKRFDTVFSLNYDLTLYWLMMASNGLQEEHQFKDCFYQGHFREDWEDLRRPIGNQLKSTLVFFPHGALQFVRASNGLDQKVDRVESEENLLANLVTHWEIEGILPLFVSEGESKRKLRSIRRSDYLSTVYHEILPNCGPSLVIYGWSMEAAVDGHLLRRLSKRRYGRIAVSVHQPSTGDVRQHIQNMKNLFGRFQLVEPIFFDAESAGAWINPAPEDLR